MNEKGVNFQVFLKVPFAVLFLMISFQLIDVFNNEAFSALDNATNSSILFISMIKLVLGIVALVLVVMFVNDIFNAFKGKGEQQTF